MAASAAREAARFSAGVSGGRCCITSSWAASSSRPLASPPASRTILPASGSGVSRPMPASSSARRLTSAEWPKDERTTTGRAVFKASSVTALVATPSGCMPCWNQLTTTSQRLASAPFSRSRQAWMRAWNCATVSAA